MNVKEREFKDNLPLLTLPGKKELLKGGIAQWWRWLDACWSIRKYLTSTERKYLLNRSSIKELQNITPKDAWSGC
jgi:hypothetical protein